MPFGSDREGLRLTDNDTKLQPPPPKKVKNTRVWSAHNIKTKRKYVLKLSYLHFKLNITTNQPFMDVVGELDVCAADA